MKKSIFILLFVFPILCFGQYHSWDGKGIAPNARVRCLNIFVNIIYDIHPDYNNPFLNTAYWPPVSDPTLEGINNTAIPVYLLDWMDTMYIPGQLHGYCTRLYGESSFDSLQIIGDFVVVNLRESTARAVTNVDTLTCSKIAKAALNLINVNGLQTIYGYNTISDYDYDHDAQIDFMNVIIRNINKQHADINPGSGYGAPPYHPLNIGGVSYYAKAGTLQCVGDGDFYANPTNIVTHEISHSLFGGNAFHTSGGNHRYVDGTVMPFLNLQGGYGLMGAAGSGLVCCNGYERWRMHWKHSESREYISARDISNTQLVASDITKESGNRNFVLRDFVTYGDAVRIKLPYKDSVTSSNQYIWLENHQVGNNSKLDFLQYSNTYTCRPQGAPGIYAYYQIGRDVLESSDRNEVWDSYHRDNLKIIPAEGYYDYELLVDTHNIQCVSYVMHPYAVRRSTENPFCGYQDQEFPLFPKQTDTLLYVSREFETWRKYIDTLQDNHLPQLGDNGDAFSTHTKINMGTNPSTNNAKTYHSTNPNTVISARVIEKNVQTTYLTGLSIEMTPIQGTGNIQVSVRWDDYDITNDTRWTGKIALKETAILTAEKTITLAQNRTVAQPKRDPETGLFAGRTRWTCENGSFFRQDSASALILTENSSVIFENGSRYELSKDARVEIHAGCSFTVQPGAKVQLKGTVEVDSGGVFILYDTAKMGSLACLIVRPGGKLVVDGGTLTSACDGEMWQGIEVVGDRTKRQLAQYQGTVELLNGAIIKNAHCAIRTGLRNDATYATTGGIVKADSAFFINNRRAVEFLSYTNHNVGGYIVSNQSYFSKSSFLVNDDNFFSQSNGSFIDHVTMWEVNGVEFKGCAFENATTDQGDRRHAIYTEDAGFKVDKICTSTAINPNTCTCSENASIHSTFAGFSTAIEANTAGEQYPVEVDFAMFENNGTGVRINGNSFASVTRCTFDMNSIPGSAHNNCGLYLDGCTGYVVEENTFLKTSYPTGPFYIDNSTGISVANSGTAANSLYRNTFTNLTKGISVSGVNGNPFLGGLQISCNVFNYGKYDIYLNSGASIATPQGSASKGADNTFNNASYNVSNLNNPNLKPLKYYYYGFGINLAPVHYSNVTLETTTAENYCSSTLCNNGGGFPLFTFAGFQSDMDNYTSAQADYNDNLGNLDNTNPQTQLTEMRHSLSDTYYTAVRTLMSDSLLDLAALEQWHTAAQPIADPYSLTETRFVEGYADPFVADADDAEMANYAEFHAMKLALRDNGAGNDGTMETQNFASLQPGGHVNWYALTPAQIAQLQTIAERNTGRASVMAKGVLCFFFGICYEDGGNATSETDPSAETRAKHTAADIADETALTVYPNPTDDLLFVELRGAGIANVALYDLQGRVVETLRATSLQDGTATLDVKSLPAGVYVLRVKDAEGREYQQKVVRR